MLHTVCNIQYVTVLIILLFIENKISTLSNPGFRHPCPTLENQFASEVSDLAAIVRTQYRN